MSDSGMQQQETGLPPLYSEIVPINAEMHAGYSLRARRSYRYAAAEVSLPLNVAEFPRAALSYPIAFSAATPSFPIAILGVSSGVNLFVDEEGNWLPGTYVPAYARRYPFFLAREKDGEKFALCLDRNEEILELSDREPLLSEGAPTPALKTAMEFCQNYHKAQALTRQVVESLEKLDLLIDRQVSIDTVDGEKMRIGGFKMIDEEKFKALPAELLSEWRDRDILMLIYAHRLSQENWSRLVERHAQRTAVKS